MKTAKSVTILFFVMISNMCLFAQATNIIRIDTVWVKKKSAQSLFTSNLISMTSSLDTTAQTSSYWFNNYEKYGFDHSGILKRLNNKLSTKSFSDVFLITFFCINYEKNPNWIRVEEWHFPTEEKAKVAFKRLQNIKNSGIFSVRPTNWAFFPYRSKIYFLSSEYFTVKSDTFTKLKYLILNTLLLEESSVIEYSR